MNKAIVYKGKDGWRWQVKARNGRILADSGEAYQRKAACLKSLFSVMEKPYVFVDGA